MVTFPCQPTQRNYIEPPDWRHGPEDGHTQRTVYPWLAPPSLQSAAHRVPCGPYRRAVEVVREELTSKTQMNLLCWYPNVPQWVVWLNVLTSPVCYISLWCCWGTSVGNDSQYRYLEELCL